VVEDSDVYSTADWTTFRSVLGLSVYSSGSFTQVHPAPPSGTNNCSDPGINGNDAEAILDAEWASAAAPSAAIVLASCTDTTNFGGFIALQNLLNTTPPAIISISYGESEPELGTAANAYVNALYQQAVAEGASIFVSSGDEGAASSDAGLSYASHGIAVSGFTSTPYNVSVGGTDFGDTVTGSNNIYWATSNTSTYGSAESYVPEIPWNNSCASQLLATYFRFSVTYGSAGFCNSSTGSSYFLTTVAGSGGPSGCVTGVPATSGVVGGTCAGYAKPSWQSVLGNPGDGVRDIPDVALFAANGAWGHYYVVCYSDNGSGRGGSACTGAPNTWSGFGGTSVSSPIMAATQALINQASGSSAGNPNPTYYSLANGEYGASGTSACNSSLGNEAESTCIFYDVTEGDMDISCKAGLIVPAPDCYLPSGTYGVLSQSNSQYQHAYGASTGWDFATGIGSINANNLVNSWPKPPSITSVNSSTFIAGTQGMFTVTVTGTPAPALTESGALPSGITFNTTTGVLGGTPAQGTGGVYNISFEASNGVGANATQNFTLTVDQVPAITSGASTTFTVGTPGTFGVTATGYPVPAVSEAGTLPNGVTFNAGQLSGTPAAGTAGTYPIMFTASNGVSPNASQNFTLTVNQPTGTGSAASFLGMDTTTKGNWKTRYGADGNVIANYGQSVPSYATFGVEANTPTYTWATNTADPRALQTTTGSIASCWYSSPTTFYFDVNITDGNTHELALYAVDWDNYQGGRSETVQVTDVNGNALDTLRTLSNYTGGTYLAWNISGHVRINITLTGGGNAVVSGVFFGGGATQTAPGITSASSTAFTVGTPGTFGVTATGYPVPVVSEAGTLPNGVTFNAGQLSGTPAAGTAGTYPIMFTASNGVSPNATQNFILTVNQSAGTGSGASFLGTDTTTKGSWKTLYGADGNVIANYGQSVPTYATFGVEANTPTYTWATNTADPRALQTTTGSIASCWYSNPTTFYLDVNITDGNTHELALYAVDWDNYQGGRSETVQVTDVNGNALDTLRTLSNYTGGTYLVWNISGHVRINVTLTGGGNAVVSGVFFGGSAE
jgi:hypothetical protein